MNGREKLIELIKVQCTGDESALSCPSRKKQECREIEKLPICAIHKLADHLIASGVTVQITGETSDGYHTFNELYHHRAVLFSVVCNLFPALAWKSKQHDDPASPMYEGMFIVGIETPAGQATYHYDIDPYWDMFHVTELARAPKWDGHTSEESIQRIGLLGMDKGSLVGRVHDDAFAAGFQEGMDHARSWMGGPGCDACPTRETYAKAAQERDGYKKELEELKQEVQK